MGSRSRLTGQLLWEAATLENHHRKSNNSGFPLLSIERIVELDSDNVCGCAISQSIGSPKCKEALFHLEICKQEGLAE